VNRINEILNEDPVFGEGGFLPDGIKIQLGEVRGHVIEFAVTHKTYEAADLGRECLLSSGHRQITRTKLSSNTKLL
jgi:hypothetical protein